MSCCIFTVGHSVQALFGLYCASGIGSSKWRRLVSGDSEWLISDWADLGFSIKRNLQFFVCLFFCWISNSSHVAICLVFIIISATLFKCSLWFCRFKLDGDEIWHSSSKYTLIDVVGFLMFSRCSRDVRTTLAYAAASTGCPLARRPRWRYWLAGCTTVPHHNISVTAISCY